MVVSLKSSRDANEGGRWRSLAPPPLAKNLSKEQIDFIKNTEKYFTENEVFDNQAFAEEVLIKPEIVESFKKYKSSFEEEKNLSLEDGFEISGNAVKDSKGFFRSVLKLDKNFHVYVHSKPEFLERGFDNSKGMNFYKLYYEEEK